MEQLQRDVAELNLAIADLIDDFHRKHGGVRITSIDYDLEVIRMAGMDSIPHVEVIAVVTPLHTIES